MKMERRVLKSDRVKLVTRAEGEAGAAEKRIAGLGAVFYDGTPATEYELWQWGNERCVERILPGAFDKALSRPDDVRGLFNHDPNQVLGRTTAGTMRLSASAAGLEYEIEPAETTVSRDVQAHLERGDVTGSSFSFVVDEERWTEKKAEGGGVVITREVVSLTLYDVGPVTFPAYSASTAGVRQASDTEEAKRSLAEFRSKVKKPWEAVAVRARAVSVAAASRRRDAGAQSVGRPTM